MRAETPGTRTRGKKLIIASGVGLAMVLLLGGVFYKQLHRWFVWGDPRVVQTDVEDVIRWFPPETEMLAVCRDHVTSSRELQPDDEGFLLAQFQGTTAGMGLWFDEELQPAETHRIRFAVEGSCAFRTPTSLGLMPYSGCHVAVFDDALGEDGDRILNRVSRRAKRFLEMSGVRVAEVEQKWESDLWKLYFAFPHANVLIVATEEVFLSRVLARRLDGSPRAALPETLPQWRDVDRSAPYWAVRHYIPTPPTLDHSSPYHAHPQTFKDGGAIGFGVALSGEELRLAYLTTTPDADILVQKIWSIPGQGLQSEVRSPRPQVFEIVPQLNSPDAIMMCHLVLLMMLGHGMFF